MRLLWTSYWDIPWLAFNSRFTSPIFTDEPLLPPPLVAFLLVSKVWKGGANSLLQRLKCRADLSEARGCDPSQAAIPDDDYTISLENWGSNCVSATYEERLETRPPGLHQTVGCQTLFELRDWGQNVMQKAAAMPAQDKTGQQEKTGVPVLISGIRIQNSRSVSLPQTSLQRTQKIEHLLLLRVTQAVERTYRAARLAGRHDGGGCNAVIRNCVSQVRSPAVVHKE